MKKQMGSKKNVPISNYIKLVLVVLVTMFIIFMLRNWYISNRDYELNIPIIESTLISKINADEVYNYVRENENAILYIGVANDSECRNFEKKFNTVIQEKSLEDVITYLNITKEKSKKKFINEFNKFYDADILGYPSIIIFEDGNVKDTLTVKIGNSLDIDDVIQFLDDNGVVADNL